MRGYFEREVSADNAHRERWREGLTPDAQEELQRFYERTLDRMAADGVHCAPQLLRAHEVA
jgi:hypothetical protein